ncbi:hypothetical protein [Lacipirellula limnantheis]|uniref:Uncharacterized protein n=1 Tax=Lacipirellula limnantheis TaxID=2528024 RepID=A0A517U1D6_9BACT|nr:hypothetical protein [Lacipirellula limnantheis]QDT74430.1 hypothetical protein I41_36260 [Lacipirellula limnantheis]
MLSELATIPALLGLGDVAVVSTADVPAVPSACLYGFALPAGSSPLDDRPLVALNMASIEADALPGRVGACTRSVLIHELGHVAAVKPVEWSPIDREFIGADMPAFRSRLLAKSANIPEPPIDAPDAHHGARFLRATLHVYGRAQQLGIEAVLSEIVGAVGNGWLSPEVDYLRVLQGEIHAMRGESFATILATPPPEAFSELWQADVALYHRNEQARCDYLRERQERLAKC